MKQQLMLSLLERVKLMCLRKTAAQGFSLCTCLPFMAAVTPVLVIHILKAPFNSY